MVFRDVSYETARNKVTWADHHIADIESRIDSLKKCLVVTSHVNPNTGCEFIKCNFTEPQGTFVDELALRLGDAVHNLHCALDHSWFQTVTRLIPSGDWRRTKFPVYPSVDSLETALRKIKIDVSTPNFFKFILGDIQPYSGGNVAIRPIHKLDTRDKHSLVIPVVHYMSIGHIYLKDKQGKIVEANTWGTIEPLPHHVEFERGLHIEEPGSATFEIMFEQGDTGHHMGMIETLRFYSHHVLMIVELLEKFRE
jgi:hypothetical protein